MAGWKVMIGWGQACCLLALSLALVGCCCPVPIPSGTSHEEVDPLTVTRVEIPLDDASGLQEATLTRNFYFIFDGSGSMADPPDWECGGDQSFETKLAGAKWAVGEFVDKVADDMNLGLYVFDRHGRSELVPLSAGNREPFLQAIGSVEAGGGTPLADAIHFGVDRLVAQYKKQLGYGEFRLVVVTDGIADDIPAAAAYGATYGIPIYAIGLCIGERHPLRQYAVSYRAADNFADLARGLEETLAELPSFDEGWHDELEGP